MNVVLASPEVAGLIRDRRGRLYVWPDRHACCGGTVTYLATGSEPERGRVFHRLGVEGFDLFLDPGRMRPPDELVLDVRGRRRRKRVEAYWNGCVFAV